MNKKPLLEVNERTVVCAKSARVTQPIILCLNLRNLTGWAVSNERGRIMSGTAHFRPRRFEGGGMRYLRFERWLNEMLEVLSKIDAVYFIESARRQGTNETIDYYSFLKRLAGWCEEQEIKEKGVPIGTIKKLIAGRGNASNVSFTKAVEALGHRPEDYNEVCAIALLYFAREQVIGGCI